MIQQLVAGIDIGGTNTVFGLTDRQGKILVYGSLKTTDYPSPLDLVKHVSEKIKQVIPEGYYLAGVGVGAPNGNYYKGTIEFAPNLKWFGVIPMADYFSHSLGCRVVLTNDANAAAIGEMVFGGAKGMKNFIVITLGTGLGSGIVVNGEVVYGHDGFAGEIGHVIVIPGGRNCGCGRSGCVETYCSATGIKRTYHEKTQSASATPVYISSQEIFNRATAGDEHAKETFEETGNILGLVLANSVAYTSPEAIFLFGGPVKAGDLLLNPTRKSFEENLLNIYKGKIKVLPSQLDENDAAILGAASLIWKELSVKNPEVKMES